MADDAPTLDPSIDLTAFADGNLEPAQSADVLEYLSIHPELAKTLARTMRFRGAVSRSIRGSTPRPSPALRDRVEHLLHKDAANEAARALPMWRARSQVWMGGLAAALFCIALGLTFGRMIYKPGPAGVDEVSATMVSSMTHTHVDCSKFPNLHNLPFPAKLSDLKLSVERTLGRDEPYPDLRPIGFAYIGAGPCAKAVDADVHLLYRSVSPPTSDTLSIFVQPFNNQVAVPEGKAYWAQPPDSAYPVLVWHKDNLVFYIVGNAADAVESAGRLMHVPEPI